MQEAVKACEKQELVPWWKKPDKKEEPKKNQTGAFNTNNNLAKLNEKLDSDGKAINAWKIGSMYKGQGRLESLYDLPAQAWIKMPNDHEGLQFYTLVKFGGMIVPMMLDGGAGTNTITETIVLNVISYYKARGISLNDRRHPIARLEYWDKEEEVKGVAGDKAVPLLGAVVMKVTMKELGKDTGPMIFARALR